MTGQHTKRVLVLTVGTGDKHKLQETLLTPIKKSVASENWGTVVFLPSQVTEDFASVIGEQLSGIQVVIDPLSRADMENDADACFAHFDRLLGQLIDQGYRPKNIIADFTRGTKAMSAALVLAAVRHGLPTLRYITGQRDQRGMVTPGSEELRDLDTTIAIAMRRVDAALRFIGRGNFAAALDLLPDPANPLTKCYPQQLQEAARWLRPWAAFYGEWDRLDYQAAARIDLPEGDPENTSWQRFAPNRNALRWVQALAADLPSEPAKMAQRLRRVAVDLLANGERRIRDGQYEDAVLRGYRVLELLGQIRLFDRGLDSRALPPNLPELRSLQKKLEKRRERGRFSINSDGTMTAARELVARLLKRMNDPLADQLLDIGSKGLVKASLRNNSLLIHGFAAVGPQDEAPLKKLYGRLEQLLGEDMGAQAKDFLAIARFINFSTPSS